MGADLYAVGFDEAQEAWQPQYDAALAARDSLDVDADDPRAIAAQAEVERVYFSLYNNEELYFRDSYNSSSVLWRLGLSWWRDVETLPDSTPNMPPELCLKLADKVEQAQLKLVDHEEFDKDFGGGTDEELNEFNDYFIKKHKRLVKFLRNAATKGGITASL